MTLISAVLTDEYVALASDRRISMKRGGRLLSQEDTGLKTSVLSGRFLMGFTGVAVLQGSSMELWLAEVLAGVQAHETFQAIQTSVQSAFDRTPGLHGIPHTFLAVGFAARSGDGVDIPVGLMISNCLDEQGRPDHRKVGRRFVGRKFQLGNSRQQLISVGWDVHPDDLKRAKSVLRALVRSNPRNALMALEPTVRLTRATAARSQGYVGESVLFATIPRVAVPIDGWELPVEGVRLRGEDRPVALSLHENYIGVDPAFAYLPSMFWPDASFTGLEIREIPS